MADTIELVGPAGRVVFPRSQAEAKRAEGWKTLEEAAEAKAAVPDEAVPPVKDDKAEFVEDIEEE